MCTFNQPNTNPPRFPRQSGFMWEDRWAESLYYPLVNSLLLEYFRKFSQRKLDSQEIFPLHPEAEHFLFCWLLPFRQMLSSWKPGPPQLEGEWTIPRKGESVGTPGTQSRPPPPPTHTHIWVVLFGNVFFWHGFPLHCVMQLECVSTIVFEFLDWIKSIKHVPGNCFLCKMGQVRTGNCCKEPDRICCRILTF